MDQDQKDALDYERTTAYYYALQDVRFKLLGFLPVISGAALAIVPKQVDLANQLGIACLGALVTLGLTSYDQRNTHIYERLLCRAKFLEMKLGLRPFPGETYGGPFHARPPLKKVWRVKPIWHNLGLSLVYAASFTAWVFLGISPFLETRRLALATITSLTFAASFVGLRLITYWLYQDTKAVYKKIESSYSANEAVHPTAS